jgi:hypothetical protein
MKLVAPLVCAVVPGGGGCMRPGQRVASYPGVGRAAHVGDRADDSTRCRRHCGGACRQLIAPRTPGADHGSELRFRRSQSAKAAGWST